MNCKSCGTENTNNAQFCTACGIVFSAKEQIHSRNCDSCGVENNADALFCSHCGTNLGRKTSQHLPRKKEVTKEKRPKGKEFQQKNSRFVVWGIASIVAVACIIILIATKEDRTNIRSAPNETRTLQTESMLQVLATVEHKIQILSNFMCPCGNCHDELKDCVCKHRNGAGDVKSFVDEQIAQRKYTVMQIIDLVNQKYGGIKERS